MYKITITQLNEIQKLLTEVVNMSAEDVDKLTTKLLRLKIKARALREKNNRIYNLK
jgi:hypothetical protein